MRENPLIWVLLGRKAGDNAQAVALAHAVGGSIVLKQLDYNRLHHLPNVLIGPRVISLSRPARKSLVPPWPDLVIGVGKRSAPVAVWIKQQDPGRTRIVHIGRPRFPLSQIDLVLTTPQYGLPQVPNVKRILLPFAKPRSVSENDLASWAERWSALPRPWLVAAIGAQKYPQVMGALELRDFGAQVEGLAAQMGGSILLFDSPRSAKGALGLVASSIRRPHWSSDRDEISHGAYPAGIKLGDAFAVTSDSVSMLTEMIAQRKPVHVFRLPRSSLHLRWAAKRGLGKLLAVSGVLQPPRNTPGLVDAMLRLGAVSELGSSPANHGTGFDLESERHDAVARVRELLATR